MKNRSSMIPASKATEARTIPGPPRALRAAARLAVDSQSPVPIRPAMAVATVFTTVQKTKKPRKKARSKLFSRSSFRPTMAK